MFYGSNCHAEGAAALFSIIVLSIEDEYEGEFTGTETISGLGSIVSIRIGRRRGRGVVIGDGLEGLSGTFDYEDDYGQFVNDREVDATGTAIFAMAQKYFGPFFLRADIGGMFGGSSDSDDIDYGGFMLGAGLGADFVVSHRWSLGLAAGIRHTAGSYDDDDGYSGDYTMTVPSLQFSGTYF